VSHPLVLALFSSASTATDAASALHALGISSEHLSVVAHDHVEARALAERMHATPGVELEDSRTAGRLGELAGRVLGTLAVFMPGIGPIVAAGPLAAELGEVAGHAAGGLASVLKEAGVPADHADNLQHQVARGAVLLGVHVAAADVARVSTSLTASGARQIETAVWPDTSSN
jgi:hypothetical protein